MKKFFILLAVLIFWGAISFFFSFEESTDSEISQQRFVGLTEEEAKKRHQAEAENDSLPLAEEAEKDQPFNQEIATLEIPFIVQAPFSEWDNPIFQDGCEEAVVLMSVYWAWDKELNRDIARQEIIAMARYQEKNYGEARDTSVEDTLERLIGGYFDHHSAFLKKGISISDIIGELKKGRAIIVPVNGRALNNPYFTQPGPERHNLVIKGYDYKTKEFITNDPGVGKGEGYRYPEEILHSAIRDYPTGYHKPITSIKKIMIIVEK